MDKLDKLDDEELKNKLLSLQEELKDVENEKGFIFKQSGMHVSSSKVAVQMAEYDADILALQESIAYCIKELKRRDQ